MTTGRMRYHVTQGDNTMRSFEESCEGLRSKETILTFIGRKLLKYLVLWLGVENVEPIPHRKMVYIDYWDENRDSTFEG